MMSTVKKLVILITKRFLAELLVDQSDNQEQTKRILVGTYNVQIHILIDLS